MLKLFSTILKEFLVLSRDRSGLAIMFIMPVALVTIMALIQDAPFRDYQELKIPALLVNNDKGGLGKKIEEGIAESKIFKITRIDSGITDPAEKVASGEYEIAIVIPENTSDRLNGKVKYFVERTLFQMGAVDSVTSDTLANSQDTGIQIYFKPGIKKSFKNSVLSSVRQVASKLESQELIASFHKTINPGDTLVNLNEEFGDFITFNENSTTASELELNSVQHNVPAWTMFGMFFIVISLAGSIIKEREDGSYLRILTMPGTYLTVMAGKVVAYLSICILQCILMLLVGIFILPWLELPELVLGNNHLQIFIVAVCSGLAATGFGVFTGTIFNTHQQSSTFGAVSVVIMAALGGIWVPVIVMPEVVRAMAEFSPLYWGLNSFQHLFLGDGSFAPISGYVYKLLLFFAVTLTASLLINNYKHR